MSLTIIAALAAFFIGLPLLIGLLLQVIFLAVAVPLYLLSTEGGRVFLIASLMTIVVIGIMALHH